MPDDHLETWRCRQDRWADVWLDVDRRAARDAFLAELPRWLRARAPALNRWCSLLGGVLGFGLLLTMLLRFAATVFLQPSPDASVGRNPIATTSSPAHAPADEAGRSVQEARP